MPRFSFLSDDTEGNELPIQHEPENKLVFSLKDYSKKSYHSSHHNEMYINGSIITDFSHEQEFDIELLTQNPAPEILLSVNRTTYEDGLGLQERFGGLLKNVTDLKNVLQLKLTQFGKIQAVTNKAALREKWDTLKQEILKEPEIQALPADLLRQMLQKGDEEYSDNYPLQVDLEKSLFHSTLFRGFYNQSFLLDQRYPVSNLLLVSGFFEELKIPMNVHLEVAYDQQYDEYILKYEGNVDKMNFDTNKAKALYSKQYPFLQEKFERYAMDFQAMHVISKQDNWLKFARVNVHEQINHSIESLINLEIEEVENV